MCGAQRRTPGGAGARHLHCPWGVDLAVSWQWSVFSFERPRPVLRLSGQFSVLRLQLSDSCRQVSVIRRECGTLTTDD